jgi:NAD(P)-dependent dehydrogenase (short-subunit alcohol dehydrogenase family)
MFELEGCNALVTGASRGLGRAIAAALWKRGANLFLTAHFISGIYAVQQELEAKRVLSGQAVYIDSVDLADRGSPWALMEAVGKRWQRINILVNNAAILGPIGHLCDVGWREWSDTIQVDLMVPAALCRACAAQMLRAHSGTIVNIAGGGGGDPNFTAYATAKTALVRFTETFAKELVGTGVRANCVAPGRMPTDIQKLIISAGPDKTGVRQHAEALAVMQGGTESIARAAELCAFLVGPRSEGITGKLISAAWDPWEKLAEHVDTLEHSDIYTLRRIVPEDRGKTWMVS